jgi:hypothetical protein
MSVRCFVWTFWATAYLEQDPSAGNGLIQLLDYARDEFEWRHHSNAGGILSLALQPAAE